MLQFSGRVTLGLELMHTRPAQSARVRLVQNPAAETVGAKARSGAAAKSRTRTMAVVLKGFPERRRLWACKGIVEVNLRGATRRGA